MWLSYFDYSSSNTVTKRGNGTTWTDWNFPNSYGASTGILDVAKTTTGNYVVLEASNDAGRPCFVTDFIPICLGDDAAAYTVQRPGRFAQRRRPCRGPGRQGGPVAGRDF